MLNKMSRIDYDNQRHLQIIASKLNVERQASSNALRIPDAEFVVTGFDGKKMFFKQRGVFVAPNESGNFSHKECAKRTAMVVPHPQKSPDENSTSTHTFSPIVKQVHLRNGFAARRWPNLSFVGVCRISGQRAIVHTNENRKQHALLVEVYSSLHSQVNSVTFPIACVLYAPLNYRATVSKVCAIVLHLLIVTDTTLYMPVNTTAN
ncbi:unnamed protein product [Phytophthora lilii]|uniref:Unnamed protein product n=1 Tax=Phytophthora lilii TaxID=2077276 RepID=A0A9W6X930_9STRA|nr:unnamed protein product [Phytophthora lilii]